MNTGTRVSQRRGMSLVEVLVASLVLAAGFFPVLLMFHSSATVAADDVRELHAYRLAEELMEQVVAIHHLKRAMGPIPLSNEAVLDSGLEMDMEDLLKRYETEQGAPLYLSGTSMMGSRFYLHPTEDGFHRYLSIDYQAHGTQKTYRSRPALLGVTVRVHYTVPRAVDTLEKDVELTTFLYADGMPPRTPDDDKAGDDQ